MLTLTQHQHRHSKMEMARRLEVIGIEGLPEIREGDDLVTLFMDALDEMGMEIEDGDAIVFTSKIISKSEGRVVSLSELQVSEEAMRIARATEKDPRIVQLILDEARELVRVARNMIIVETRHGFICANAGIDESNVEEDKAVLLPEDPQASATQLRRAIEERSGKKVAVLVSDSFGRAFRDGVTGICIGVSGLPALLDRRGELDRFGKVARITKEAVADEICAAANLVMGEFIEGIPIVIARGVHELGLVSKRGESESGIKEVLFSKEEDLFR